MTSRDERASEEQPLLAEDLLLLLFQPDSGTIAGEGTLFYVLAGAVLTELSLSRRIGLDESGRRRDLVRALGDAPPSDELLRAAWQYVADKPRSAQTVLAAVGPRLRQPVLDRLVERGDLRTESRRTLGMFRTTALRIGETDRRAGLLERVRAVLVDGAQPDLRTAALTALISASGSLPAFHREIPWTAPVIARAKELEQGDWGAGAAAEAVTRTATAVVTNAVAVATAHPHPRG